MQPLNNVIGALIFRLQSEQDQLDRTQHDDVLHSGCVMACMQYKAAQVGMPHKALQLDGNVNIVQHATWAAL